MPFPVDGNDPIDTLGATAARVHADNTNVGRLWGRGDAAGRPPACDPALRSVCAEREK